MRRDSHFDAVVVTRFGLHYLETHPRLHGLDLFEVPVGDDVAILISRIRTIGVVGISDTEISFDGVQTIRSELPDHLVLHHDGDLSEPLVDLDARAFQFAKFRRLLRRNAEKISDQKVFLFYGLGQKLFLYGTSHHSLSAHDLSSFRNRHRP